MKAIEQLLRDRIGLDPGTLGPSVIARTVRLRMKALRLQRTSDYLSLLEHSAAEWNGLVESVVVAETWFFRDRQSFATLTRLAREQGTPSLLPLRLLSVPCSSGEEPYSMAMALLDAGLPPASFQIHAADISARALVTARRAVYGRNSFRGGDLGYRERFFQRVEQGFALRASIRELVSFSLGNVLDDAFLAGVPPYDFIFCRNLLIYFDRPTQAKVLKRLEEWLDDNGLLFVGAAELPLAVNNGFVSVELPLAFACRKVRPPGATPSGGAHARLSRSAPKMTAPQPSPSLRRLKPLLSPSPVRHIPAGAGDTLSRVRQLADAGQLREATSVCQAHLQTHGASAEAYYLLGLMADAQGLTSASEYYRRALYLDPSHHDALVQMSRLCEKRGDAARARVFSRRAERARPKV